MDEYELKVLSTYPQFVLLRVSVAGSQWWCLSFVYGSPTPHFRQKLWMDLSQDSLIQNYAWI